MDRPVNVAIAHDYLTQRGGAEKVVLAMSRAFPDAVIYTTLYEPDTTYPEFAEREIVTSPLNKLRFFRKHHRAALPLLPLASSALNIEADVVIASSSGWSHGFRASGKKIVYCYSPARWLYQQDVYLGPDASRLRRLALQFLTPFLTRWDRRAAESVDAYYAISTVVQSRIDKEYGRSSGVIPAPQMLPSEGLTKEVPLPSEFTGFYLCVSRLLPYKNVDRVVSAFNESGRPLIVVGTGPEEQSLQQSASSNILFLKNLHDAEMRYLYRKCSGLVAASYEDFGLTPLEAASHGKPSAVLRWGGFLDTQSEGVSGVFFDGLEPASINAAVDELARRQWSKDAMREHLSKYEEDVFAENLHHAVQFVLAEATAERHS